MKIITLGTQSSPRKIIWLHGIGAGCIEEAKFIYHALQIEAEFIFPIAPVRSVAWAENEFTTAWFDMNGQLEADGDDLRDAVQAINQLALKRFVGQTVVLAGFSQGAALAIQCWLDQQFPFERVLALSGWLINKVPIDLKGKNLWMGHGGQDQVIPLSLGKQSAEYLKKGGANVDFHVYQMGHEVCLTEMADVRTFIA